jgi:hypothetical protein
MCVIFVSSPRKQRDECQEGHTILCSWAVDFTVSYRLQGLCSVQQDSERIVMITLKRFVSVHCRSTMLDTGVYLMYIRRFGS